MTDFELRDVTEADARNISILVETSFEGPGEARLIMALRNEQSLALELIAVENGHVIGHVAFPRLLSPQGWVALAPLTVRADRREKGVGSALVRVGIDRLRQARTPAVLVLGDPNYYQRFGFSVRAAEKLRSAYPRNNLMMLPFQPDLAGQGFDVDYPTPFFRNLGDSRG